MPDVVDRNAGIMMPGDVDNDHSMDAHASDDVDKAAETVTPLTKID